MPDKVSIIITNWNGVALLQECIPSVIEAVEFDGGRHEIIVVDDASTDNSVSFVKSNYSQVRVIELEKNSGFGIASNIGVAGSKNSIAILLNNDVIVKKNFIRPLIKPFEDNEVFAVGPKVLWKDRANKEIIYFGKAEARLQYGLLKVKYPQEIESKKMERPGVSLFAGGGFAAFDKKKFLQIGGFDKIYYPFYFEDLDLSYCAWKRGWKVLYEPQSIVYHKHQATIGKNFSKNTIRCAEKKNALIFVWKNITDKKMLAQHIFFLLPRLFWWLITGNIAYVGAFGRACKQIPEVLAARTKEGQYHHISDKEIVKIVNN